MKKRNQTVPPKGSYADASQDSSTNHEPAEANKPESSALGLSRSQAAAVAEKDRARPKVRSRPDAKM